MRHAGILLLPHVNSWVRGMPGARWGVTARTDIGEQWIVPAGSTSLAVANVGVMMSRKAVRIPRSLCMASLTVNLGKNSVGCSGCQHGAMQSHVGD